MVVVVLGGGRGQPPCTNRDLQESSQGNIIREQVSYCGDLDVLGFEKPQGVYRRVLWDVSPLEIAVHAPVPKGKTEVVAQWGWPDERQSWSWDGWDAKGFEPMQM